MASPGVRRDCVGTCSCAIHPVLACVQVYRARIAATGQEVAVKVQRPAALATISKDMYVLRRGVGVYERIVRRFTAQTTDYQSLLSTFAEGLYTEMDFRNEALNAQRMSELLAGRWVPARVHALDAVVSLTLLRILIVVSLPLFPCSDCVASNQVIIPQPVLELTTRRVLTMEWITGVKLTSLQPEEVRALVKVGQESFLTQLLSIGFMHGGERWGSLVG